MNEFCRANLINRGRNNSNSFEYPSEFTAKMKEIFDELKA